MYAKLTILSLPSGKRGGIPMGPVVSASDTPPQPLTLFCQLGISHPQTVVHLLLHLHVCYQEHNRSGHS